MLPHEFVGALINFKSENLECDSRIVPLTRSLRRVYHRAALRADPLDLSRQAGRGEPTSRTRRFNSNSSWPRPPSVYFASSVLTGSQSESGGWLANAFARVRNNADGLSTSATR